MYFIIIKIFCFFNFGLFGLILSPFIGPLVFLCIHPREKAEKKLRSLISFFFKLLLKTAIFLRIIELNIDNLKKIEEARGLVICANHPTILDAVILMAYMPNADCIVKGSYWKNPITRGIVSRLYIPNNLDAKQMQRACQKSMKKGNNLLIFPEGTRTPPHIETPETIKRSASHIALLTNSPILPIHIQATKPSSIGKGDPFFSSPADGKILFSLTVKNQIKTEAFSDFSRPIAARRLTGILKADIFSIEERYE